MILQARQAPVARDLRLIHVLQAVANHVVRAGTLCEHTCYGIAETRDAERDPDLAAILREMAHGARDLFRRGLDVFETRDIEHSEELDAADDRIDLMYSEAMNLAVNPGKEEAGNPEWRVRAALTVHYLERIADHGVDIGERTVFLVTGERMDSALLGYRERRLDEYED
jgi:phosphate transport system protein